MLTLRPYQEQAIEELRVSFRNGKRAPLLVMPTGSGKTVAYSAITESAAKRGKRIVILEHRRELVSQASVALGHFGVRHRIIAPSDKVAMVRRMHVEKIGWPMVDDSSHVAVASVQTLVRRLDWLKLFNPDTIIIDEADLAAAATWQHILAAVPGAKVIGVTATPCRTDGAPLDGIFDDMVLGPSPAELIEMGNLCRVRVFAPPVKADLSGVHTQGGDYVASELAELLDKPSVTGDAIDHYRRIAHNKPAIVFCASVKHAEHVAADFRTAGYRFEVVTGNMDGFDRDDRISGLASGKYHGIVTVDVVSRGTDIPIAEVAIMLRPTQSLALYLQQIGRVMRPAPGKEYGICLDHSANVLRFGLPETEREWTLEGRKRGARAAKENEPAFRVIQCEKCFAAFTPQPACPMCGHINAKSSALPEQRDGELQEITPEAIAMQQARKAQGSARTLAQLKAMGMGEGRALHVLQAREEKDRLRADLSNLAMAARKAGIDVAGLDVLSMKPKALRENIERLKSELGHVEFMGANDNKPMGVAM